MNAPKITLADIEANIVREEYFTAAQGVYGRNADEELQRCGESASLRGIGICHEVGLHHVTLCALVLKNGTKIVGVNYGPVSRENFNAEQGRQEARKHAIEQVWPLMGYVLRENLAQTEPVDSIYAPRAAERIKEGYAARIGMRAPEPPKWLEPWQERVIAESRELEDRLAKLRSFLSSAAVAALTGHDQERLHRQATIMDQYAKVLAERIAAFK